MFKNLTEEESQQLSEAIPTITVLIAGADGNIDMNEIEWANKLTKIRSYSYLEELKPYYTKIGETFEVDLMALIGAVSKDTDERNQSLSNKLAALNPILAKLDNSIAYPLYESYLSFAEHVAKASGGFLRFASISTEEKSLINLDMIDRIELELDSDEEIEFVDPV